MDFDMWRSWQSRTQLRMNDGIVQLLELETLGIYVNRH